MAIDGPILQIGKISLGQTPLTAASPRCLIIQVKTQTSMGEFLDLEILPNGANDLMEKLKDFFEQHDFLKVKDALRDPDVLE